VIQKGLEERCYFISFDYHALDLTRKLAPSIPSLDLIDTKHFRRHGIGRAGIIKVITNKHNISCRHWLMTKKIVQLAKANNVFTSV
jgi:glycerophosphoryl diester phosphodiesterase